MTILQQFLATLDITDVTDVSGVPHALVVTNELGDLDSSLLDGLDLSMVHTVTAGTAYVSPTSGLDTNNGTVGAPFKTIAAALAKLAADGSVSGAVTLFPGIYADPVAIDGTLGHIAFIGYGGAFIMGTITVSAGNGVLTAYGLAFGTIAVIGGTRPMNLLSVVGGAVSAAGAATITIQLNSETTITSVTGDFSSSYHVQPSHVGNTTAQWNADKIKDKDVDTPVDDRFMYYDGITMSFINAVATLANSGSGISLVEGITDNEATLRTLSTTTTGLTIATAAGDITFNIDSAGLAQVGLVQIAGQAEVDAGTETTKAVAPDTLKALLAAGAAINASHLKGKELDDTNIADGYGWKYDQGTDKFIMVPLFSTLDDTAAGEVSLLESSDASAATLRQLAVDTGMGIAVNAGVITMSVDTADESTSGITRLANNAEHIAATSNTIAATPLGVSALLSDQTPGYLAGWLRTVQVFPGGAALATSNNRGLVVVNGMVSIPNTLSVGFNCLVYNETAGDVAITSTLTVAGTSGAIIPAGTLAFVELYKTGIVLVTIAGAGLSAAERLKLTDLPDLATLEALYARLGVANIYTEQQSLAQVALTDGATVAWNLKTQSNARLLVNGSRTMLTPLNIVQGATYELVIEQGVTGGHQLAFVTAYRFPQDVAPVLTASPGGRAIFTFKGDNGQLLGTKLEEFS